MSEENKIETVEVKKECFCKSEWFKKFLTKTLAVFVGVFSALSLFAALHKPPMPPSPYGYRAMMRPAMHCQHHFVHHRCGHGCHFHKKMEKRDFQRFEKQDIEKQSSNK